MPKNVNKKESKDKKHFFKDFKAELKRVIWPTPKQLLNNTVAVITVVLITAAIVFVLDFAFESMNKYGIDKLKELVDSNNSVETTNNIDTNTEDTNTVSENEVSNETSNEIVEEDTNQADENSVADEGNSVE